MKLENDMAMINAVNNNKYISNAPKEQQNAPSMASPSPALQQLKADSYGYSITEIPQEVEKKSKTGLIAGIALGATAVGTAILVLTNPAKWTNKLNDVIKQATKNSDSASKFNKTAVKEALKGDEASKKVLEAANTAANVNTLKDTYTVALLEKIPGFKKFSDFTSGMYKKAIHKMTGASYEAAQKTADEFNTKLLDSITDPVKKAKVQELLDLRTQKLSELASGASKRIDDADASLDAFVSEGGLMQKARESSKDAASRAFKSKGKDLGGFKDVAIAEDLVKGQKEIHVNKLADLSDEIDEIDDKIIKEFGSDVIEHEASIAFSKSQKSIHKAIQTESNDAFDKLRDVKLGCAPTDALGVVTSAGSMAVLMGLAKDKHEKVDVALTTGLPLTLSTGATTFATLKMYSGKKALLIGLITGVVTGTICKNLNNIYQKANGIEDHAVSVPTLDDTVLKINDDIKKHVEDITT